MSLYPCLLALGSVYGTGSLNTTEGPKLMSVCWAHRCPGVLGLRTDSPLMGPFLVSIGFGDDPRESRSIGKTRTERPRAECPDFIPFYFIYLIFFFMQ